MRKFIIQCVCFLLPLLVVAGVAEMYMRHLPNSYQQKETWMQAHASEVEVLILGNSHGLFGLRLIVCHPGKPIIFVVYLRYLNMMSIS